MTILDRVLTPPFLHLLHRPHVHCSGTNQGAKVVGAGAEGASSGITSTSWEGLHFAINEDVDVDNEDVDVDYAVADGLHPNLDLGRFLDSLMYGE